MKIPNYIEKILEKLEKAGYEAYIVGGCVRDLLMGLEPKDWDVTTNARPEEILKVFPKGKCENKFGTVLVSLAKENQAKFDLLILSRNIKVTNKDKDKAITIAKKYLNKIKCRAHDIRHASNVVKNALEIANDFDKINKDIVEIAGYFHDVGRAKYNDSQHIEESAKITKKELSFLNIEIRDTILKIIQDDFNLTAIYLENQIIKEADFIDGIDSGRCKIVQKIGLNEHLEWIENNFNWDNYYIQIITETGRRLLSEKIKNFNKGNFGFMLPVYNTIVEITTYRSEQGYSDRRHPDRVVFEDKLENDLARRDFTVNSLVMKSTKSQIPISKQITNYKLQITKDLFIIDLFGGKKDLEKKIIRAVGEPVDRFKEDALRMIRAVRLASQLGFTIEPKTERAIKKIAGGLKFIANERIRDELTKLLESDKAHEGAINLYNTKLLQYIIPELLIGEKVKQDRHHIYTVFKHSMLSLKFCPSKDWRVKLASWLHDIGKPKTKVIRKGVATFYNHEYVSAKMVNKIMKRLKFANNDIEKVVNLVRYHMFYYNTDEVTASSVRRLISKVGTENLKDLINVRIADRLGSGTPKAKPYKLRHLEYMFKRVQNDPVSVKKLKINGDYMISKMNLKPGPKMGAILDVLLSEIIENPKLNNLKYLEKRANELDKFDVKELRKKAKNVIEEKRTEDDKKMKKEFYVK